MATNSIYQFAPTDTGSNLLTDADYLAASDRSNGNQPGVASAKLNNKALRQATLMAAGLAQFIADRQATNVADTLTAAQIAAMLASSASGRLVRKLVYQRVAGVLNVSINGGAFTTVGAGTYVPGTSMAFCIAKVQGAGAAGAGCSLPSAGNVNCGSPGGSGSYGESLFTLAQIGASQAITVGVGGAAAVGSNGTAGGASSLGSLLTAPGGIPGTQTGNVAPPVVQGNGNFSTAPTGANLLAVRGTGGTVTMAPSGGAANGSIAGNGGISIYGPGGSGPAGNNSGISAVNFGTGGSGSVINNGFGGNTAGGAGMDGIIIIEEYAA